MELLPSKQFMLEVLYKKPSPILVKRLPLALPTIIGDHQHGFVVGKDIKEPSLPSTPHSRCTTNWLLSPINQSWYQESLWLNKPCHHHPSTSSLWSFGSTGTHASIVSFIGLSCNLIQALPAFGVLKEVLMQVLWSFIGLSCTLPSQCILTAFFNPSPILLTIAWYCTHCTFSLQSRTISRQYIHKDIQ
jgi:hypothetical protein